MISQRSSHSIKNFNLLVHKCRDYDIMGSIYEGYSKNDQKQKALIQAISKNKLREKKTENLIKNIEKFQNLADSNILRIYDYYDSRSNFYIIFEEASLTLRDFLNKTENINEQDAIEILKKIIISFKSIYSNDLMPIYFTGENFFISNEKIKQSLTFISNFENIFSLIFENEKIRNFYIAPEIFEKIDNFELNDFMLLENKERETCSVWSLGILFYRILFGSYPFTLFNKNIEIKDFLKNLKKEIYLLENKMNLTKKNISKNTKSFLKSLLEYSPNSRIKWKEILESFLVKKNNIILRSESNSLSDVKTTPEKGVEKIMLSERASKVNENIAKDLKGWNNEIMEEFYKNSQVKHSNKDDSPIKITYKIPEKSKEKTKIENNIKKIENNIGINEINQQLKKKTTLGTNLLEEFEKELTNVIKNEENDEDDEEIIITRISKNDDIDNSNRENKLGSKDSIFKQHFYKRIEEQNLKTITEKSNSGKSSPSRFKNEDISTKDFTIKVLKSDEDENKTKKILSVDTDLNKIQYKTNDISFTTKNLGNSLTSNSSEDDFSPIEIDVKTYISKSNEYSNEKIKPWEHEYETVVFIQNLKKDLKKKFNDFNLKIYFYFLNKFAITKLNNLVKNIKKNVDFDDLKSKSIQLKNTILEEYLLLYEQVENEKNFEFGPEIIISVGKTTDEEYKEYKTAYQKIIYNLFQKVFNKSEVFLKNGDEKNCVFTLRTAYYLICCLNTDRFFPFLNKKQRIFNFEEFHFKIKKKSASKLYREINLLLKKII